MSHAYELLQEHSRNARAEQDSNDGDVQQMLNASHALAAVIQAILDSLITLSANSLMHGKPRFYWLIAHSSSPNLLGRHDDGRNGRRDCRSTLTLKNDVGVICEPDDLHVVTGSY